MTLDKWYNSQEGVKEAQVSLEAFLELVEERQKAGYNRRERLTEFKVLGGKYLLDTCGNTLKRQHVFSSGTSYSMDVDLPLPNLKCLGCGESWNIQNIDDTVVRSDQKVIPLEEFIGKNLADVKKHYSSLTDAVYFMQPDSAIRNDSNINLSPVYPGTEEKWKKEIVINSLGWIGQYEGLTDEYIIRAGDEGSFQVRTYLHKICNREDLKNTYSQRFQKIFQAAGFEDLELTPKNNEYCQCERCAPWFDVKTEYGTISIGWRKRVINIDVSATNLNGLDRLFSKEETTKTPMSIHAWGWDKAQDYLTVFYQVMRAKI